MSELPNIWEGETVTVSPIGNQVWVETVLPGLRFRQELTPDQAEQFGHLLLEMAGKARAAEPAPAPGNPVYEPGEVRPYYVAYTVPGTAAAGLGWLGVDEEGRHGGPLGVRQLERWGLVYAPSLQEAFAVAQAGKFAAWYERRTGPTCGFERQTVVSCGLDPGHDGQCMAEHRLFKPRDVIDSHAGPEGYWPPEEGAQHGSRIDG